MASTTIHTCDVCGEPAVARLLAAALLDGDARRQPGALWSVDLCEVCAKGAQIAWDTVQRGLTWHIDFPPD